jgi:hypothetical protein
MSLSLKLIYFQGVEASLRMGEGSQGWIPACAGMTALGKNAAPSPSSSRTRRALIFCHPRKVIPRSDRQAEIKPLRSKG